MILSIGALALAYLCYLIFRGIYNTWLHPLKRIPGPLVARATNSWLIFHDIAGSRTEKVHKLHQTYGPVVRVAPNEISFATSSAVRKIYSQTANCTKSPFYAGFTIRTPAVFMMRNREEHRERRRMLNDAYTKASVMGVEPLVAEQIRKFLVWLEKQEEGAAINVHAWFRLFAFDVAGSLFMGESNGALDSDKPHPYINDMDAYLMTASLEWDLPYLTRLTSWIPIPRLQSFLNARWRVERFTREKFERYVEKHGRKPERKDMLMKLIAGETVSGDTLSDKAIVAEITTQIVGATDTTGTTLTYTAWELAKSPTWQDTLQKEMKEAAAGFDGSIPTYKDIKDLPLLNAFVMESLRLYPPVPLGLPRLIPAEGLEIDGYFLPGGTTVGVPSYTIHRNANVFESPDEFRPMRWLSETGTPDAKGSTDVPDTVTTQIPDAYMPFSRGPRSCIGIHLAHMEMKLLTAAILMSWEIGVGGGTTEESMSVTDHGVYIPKAGRCDLTFKRIKSY